MTTAPVTAGRAARGPAAARLQVLGVARAGVGGAWLVGLLTGRAGAGADLPPVGRVAAGALAVRDVAQGALLVARPRLGSAEAGAAIDLLHAASMLPVLALSPRLRVAAATSGTAALGWVLAAVLVGARSGPRSR